MVELTDREKKIILIKFIMHGNSPYSTLSIDDREKHLIASMQLLGFDYSKDEMLDIGESILALQKQLVDSAQGFINSMPKDVIASAMKYSMSMFKR